LQKCTAAMQLIRLFTSDRTLPNLLAYCSCRKGHPIMRLLIDAIKQQQNSSTNSSSSNTGNSAGKSSSTAVAAAGAHSSALLALLNNTNSSSSSSNNSSANTAAPLSATSLLAAFTDAAEVSAALEAVSIRGSDVVSDVTSTIVRTGPGLFTRTVMHYAATQGLGQGVVFPTEHFYPIANNEVFTSREQLAARLAEVKQRGVALAAHLWAKSWQ
jgi:hypothetical protein